MKSPLRVKSLLRSLCIVLFAGAAVLAAAEPLVLPRMISVRGGTFIMGSNEGSFRTTERPHEAALRPFLLSETEITQKLYRDVMNENPSFFRGDDLPVENVSWLDAVLFCNALSARSGLSPAYTVDGEKVSWNRESGGYRLPTEAEWEYAARDGPLGPREAPEKVFFSGGGEGANPADYCWYSMNGERKTHPVGEKLPNQLGFRDMSGNVWEWCWDWSGDYPEGPVNDYAGPSAGRTKIYRGGSYINNMNQLRTTFRIWESPSFKYRTLGFRIARNG